MTTAAPYHTPSLRTYFILVAAYAVLFVVAAIHPYDRAVWWAENIPIVLIVLSLALIRRYAFVFSATAYVMMFVLLYLHTIGGHYTFERVPFGFVNDLFGFERNNYDRFGHFSVGFYAYAIAEYLLVKQLVRSRALLYLFPLFSILALAAVYEIFEWLYAVNADASAGIAVLGSQGDIWDAQKDMLADGSGAVFALVLFYIRYAKVSAKLLTER
jgi:putative membrane protein